MEKKSILIILVIIILIIIIGVFAFNQPTSPDTQVKVGSSTFNLPSGFYSVNSNKPDVVNITNGYDDIYLKECGDKNITKYVNKYVKDIKENNETVKIKNFTVDNVVVYKCVVNNTNKFHYWFNHDGKVYTCYTYNGSNKMDDIVTDLIKKSN